jgi:hypothetical protein
MVKGPEAAAEWIEELVASEWRVGEPDLLAIVDEGSAAQGE